MKLYLLAYIRDSRFHSIYFMGIRIRWKVRAKVDSEQVHFSFWERLLGCKNSKNGRKKIFCFLGMKFTRKIPGAISVYKIYNKKIGKVSAEIIHIMANNNFTGAFYDIVKKYNNNHQHLFIVYKGSQYKYISPIQQGKDVVFGNLSSVKIDFKKTKKIIVHGILETHIFEWLYNHPKYLNITYWSIWSADLYKFFGDMYDYVRKNVKAIITIYDKDNYIKRYGNKKCFNAFYLNPLANYISFAKQRSDNRPLTVQINQCATRDTLRVLDLLAKYKNENIMIWSPTSYSKIGEKITSKEIEQYGKNIFGNKFFVQNDYLSPKQYAEKISLNDIIIVNSAQQGGVGNLAAAFYMGKKVYVNISSSSLNAFNKSHQKYYNYEDIRKQTFNEFAKISEHEKVENYSKIKKYFSEKFVAALWENVFSDEEK